MTLKDVLGRTSATGRSFQIDVTDAADTDEKRAIGALWEKASGGKGLFLMAEKQVDGKDVRAQMLANVH